MFEEGQLYSPVTARDDGQVATVHPDEGDGGRKSGPSRLRPKRQISPLTVLGIGLLVIGMACLGWVAFQYFGTNVVSERAFETESQRLREKWTEEKKSDPGKKIMASDVPGEAIALLRACWTDAHVNFAGKHYRVTEMAMEPKSPQAGRLPIWVGGESEAAKTMIAEQFAQAGQVYNENPMALHLRGNTEAYMLAASKHKKLRIHTGTHFHPFHSEEGRMDQLRWFDHWLKGIDTGIMDEPPVKLEIRTGGSTERYAFRHENEWPLARTQWTKMYLKVNAKEQNKSGEPEGERGQGDRAQDHQPPDARSGHHQCSPNVKLTCAQRLFSRSSSSAKRSSRYSSLSAASEAKS